MKIQIRPISSLLDYTFTIPNYQRGYRWDNEQVEALLNDLKSFVQRSDKGMFYCLQPVVVVKESDDKYIVVDGQQRLTTIYLMMTLRGLDKKYDISLPGREKQDEFIHKALFADPTDTTYSNNIDNFYLRKAYETMKTWKSKDENDEEFDHFKYIFSKSDSRYGYAAIIWYDLSEENSSDSPEKSRRKAMSAFRRLNFGKIPLTSAELVKALLLQTDLYPETEVERQKSVAQRRSMEWDEMEHRLSNPLFASMVTKKETEKIAGIDIILDVVAEKLNKTLEKKQTRKNNSNASSDLFAFHVVDQKIKEEMDKTPDDESSRSKVIESIWQEIQLVFNNLSDWYKNREWFHLIGLIRQISKLSSRDFIFKISNMTEKKVEGSNEISPIVKKSKSEFREALIKEIGNAIRVKIATVNKQPLPDNQQGLASPNLRYRENEQNTMINILIALNVLMCMQNKDSSVRFPFHLFRKYKATSLEHIHPQNINENLEFKEAWDWLKDRKADAETADLEVWKRAARSIAYFSGDDDNDLKALEEAINKAKDRVNAAIRKAGNLMTDETAYNDNKDEIYENLKILDLLFGDMAAISQSELHSIWNMALIPSEINSALSNNYLDRKREILSENTEKSYIPPATLKVFSKEFRPGNPGNMKFWQPEDRQAYREKLQETYDYFTSKN
ncbi:MAG: DUF262 domain-containing protein [Muribaculaceae bacterium]|nr:DUF262 domain-containing protein [Muribaculaceae bacterium]